MILLTTLSPLSPPCVSPCSGCRRDEDGYYWITGRVDDVLNCSGHRLGTAEIESALCVSDKCAEAAVLGFPHEIKGQGIICYVILAAGVAESDAVVADLKAQVRSSIGPFATPDIIAVIPGLPKTRSGKIMRRILRKVSPPCVLMVPRMVASTD